MKYVPVEFDPGINVTRRHPLKEFAVLFSAAIGLLIVVYLLLGMAIELAARNITVAQERWLWSLTGDAPDETMFVGGPDDDEYAWYVAYVQSLVDRIPRDMIGDAAGYDLRVRVLWDEMPNAFAVPGGEIWVTTGLLDFVESENELMAVLGHEVGHFIGRDQLEGYGRGIVAFGASLALFGQGNGLADWITGTIDLLDLSHSRSQEMAADIWGLRIAYAIYGHAGGVTDFDRRMVDFTGDAGPIVAFLSTHPGGGARIRQLETIVADEGLAVGEPIPIDRSIEEFFAAWTAENAPPADAVLHKKKRPPASDGQTGKE
jgi:Zn-dependent protease with chaperone function